MLVSARIDRLVITPDRVLAVDFKTQRPAPDSEVGVDQAAITQMAVYGAVLAELFPRRQIATALLFTDGPRLIEIKASTRDAALERLRQTGRQIGRQTGRQIGRESGEG
jgi:ATP-dependent helicase/nuclease subunit A